VEGSVKWWEGRDKGSILQLNANVLSIKHDEHTTYAVADESTTSIHTQLTDVPVSKASDALTPVSTPFCRVASSAADAKFRTLKMRGSMLSTSSSTVALSDVSVEAKVCMVAKLDGCVVERTQQAVVHAAILKALRSSGV